MAHQCRWIFSCRDADKAISIKTTQRKKFCSPPYNNDNNLLLIRLTPCTNERREFALENKFVCAMQILRKPSPPSSSHSLMFVYKFSACASKVNHPAEKNVFFFFFIYFRKYYLCDIALSNLRCRLFFRKIWKCMCHHRVL